MKQLIQTIAFVAAAACAAGAFAQQPQFTKDGKRIGTRDELRACYVMRDDIDSKQAAIKARGEKLTKESNELREESELLNRDVASADNDGLTGPRRTRLEKRVKEHQARVKAMQDEDAALKGEIEGLEKLAATQKEKCSNMAFENEDVAAVRQEREAAGKK